MKKILMFLVILLSLAGCKNKENHEPGVVYTLTCKNLKGEVTTVMKSETYWNTDSTGTWVGRYPEQYKQNMYESCYTGKEM